MADRVFGPVDVVPGGSIIPVKKEGFDPTDAFQVFKIRATQAILRVGTYLVNSSAGPINLPLNLPADAKQGVTFFKTDGSSNAVTIRAAKGGLINGAQQVQLTSQWAGITLVKDGDNYITADGAFAGSRASSFGSSGGSSGAPWMALLEDGQDGEPGPPGRDAQGIPGIAGRPGLDGNDGEDGLTIPGIAGPQGSPGFGIPGIDGADGEDGFTIPGPIGLRGCQGIAGIPGDDGGDGEPGPPGVAGAAGATGATGATGSTGAAGVAGIAGPPGPWGEDGLDGDMGPPGLMTPLIVGPGCTFDGGGTVLAAGAIARVYVPYACTIKQAVMCADVSGSAVVDVWALAGATSIPTVANTIAASALPTLSSQQASSDATLTGWTTTITAGTWVYFKLNSASTVTQVHLFLVVSR